jgi:hypothetical protein
MVERRIKPHHEQLAEAERRNLQRRAFRRNQTFGLLIIAAAILAWWLFHTNPNGSFLHDGGGRNHWIAPFPSP